MMKILLWGILCFHVVFSVPQIYQDNPTNSADLYDPQLPHYSNLDDLNPSNLSKNINQHDAADPAYNSLYGTYKDLTKRRMHREELSIEHESHELANKKPYEVQNNRRSDKGPYIVQEGGTIGKKKNYRVVLRERYKIRDPTVYNVNRTVKTIERSKPIIHKTYRTSYNLSPYTGYEPYDRTTKVHHINKDGNQTTQPIFDNSDTAREHINMNNYSSLQNLPIGYSDVNDNDVSYIKELTNDQAEYTIPDKLKLSNQNRVEVTSDISVNSQNNDYSYVYSKEYGMKQPLAYNLDADFNNNYNQGYDVPVLNSKYSPEVLNTNNYEFNTHKGLQISGKNYSPNYGTHISYKNQTGHDNTEDQIIKESQVLIPLSFENQSAVVNSSGSQYSPSHEITEFEERLLQINQFLKNNLHKSLNLRSAEVGHDVNKDSNSSEEEYLYNTESIIDVNNASEKTNSENLYSTEKSTALNGNVSQDENSQNKDDNVSLQPYKEVAKNLFDPVSGQITKNSQNDSGQLSDTQHNYTTVDKLGKAVKKVDRSRPMISNSTVDNNNNTNNSSYSKSLKRVDVSSSDRALEKKDEDSIHSFHSSSDLTTDTVDGTSGPSDSENVDESKSGQALEKGNNIRSGKDHVLETNISPSNQSSEKVTGNRSDQSSENTDEYLSSSTESNDSSFSPTLDTVNASTTVQTSEKTSTDQLEVQANLVQSIIRGSFPTDFTRTSNDNDETDLTTEAYENHMKRLFPVPEIAQSIEHLDEDPKVNAVPVLNPDYIEEVMNDRNHPMLTSLRTEEETYDHYLPRKPDVNDENRLSQVQEQYKTPSQPGDDPLEFHDIKNYDYEPENDMEEDEPTELLKLCALVKTNLSKLRKFVATAYGLNTKTANENDLISIVYIMGKLNEARQTKLPVENVVDDFLINLRRLAVLRKLLCNDTDDTEHAIDLNYEDSADKGTYFDKVFSLYKDHSLLRDNKSPRYYERYYPKEIIDENENKNLHSPKLGITENPKQTVYSVEPGYLESAHQNLYATNSGYDSIMKKLHPTIRTNEETMYEIVNSVTPGYLENTNQNDTVQPSYVENLNENKYLGILDNVEYTSQNLYPFKANNENTIKPSLIKNKKQNGYTDRPDYIESTKQDGYSVQPGSLENSKQNDYSLIEPDVEDTNQNMYSFKPNDVEKTNPNFYRIKPGFVDNTNQKKYLGTPDYVENTIQNLYSRKPNYVDNFLLNNYSDKSDSVGNTEQMYSLKLDHEINEIQQAYALEPHYYIPNTYKDLYSVRPDYVESTDVNDYSDTSDYLENTQENVLQPGYKIKSMYSVTPDNGVNRNQDLSSVIPDVVPPHDEMRNTLQNLYQIKPDFVVNSYPNKYTGAPDDVENTDQNLYSYPPRYENNKKLHLYPDIPDDINQNLYSRPDNVENTYENLYQTQPGYKEITIQDLYPIRPGFIENTNQDVFSVRPDYSENAYGNIYDTPDTENTYENLYPIRITKQNIDSDTPGYVENAYEYLYPMRPDDVDNINQNYDYGLPDYLNTKQNVYSDTPDYVENINKIYRNKPGYEYHGHEYSYPIKPVERDNDLVTIESIEPDESTNPDLKLKKSTTQEYPRITDTSYDSPQYSVILSPPKLDEKENGLDRDDLAATEKPTDLHEVVSITSSPYTLLTNTTSPEIHGVHINIEDESKEAMPDVNTILIKKPIIKTNNNFGGISEEDYNQNDYEYYNTKHPENEYKYEGKESGLYEKLNHEPMSNYWKIHGSPNTKPTYWDVLSMYYDKTFKKLIEAYLNGKKLHFRSRNNIIDDINNLQDIRISGFLNKDDLETLVKVARYHSTSDVGNLVNVQDLNLLLELRDKIDDSIVTNVIWFEILRLRLLGVSEQKIDKFVYMLVTTELPRIFGDVHKCQENRLNKLQNAMKYLNPQGKWHYDNNY